VKDRGQLIVDLECGVVNAGRIALGAMVAFSAGSLIAFLLMAMLLSHIGLRPIDDFHASAANHGLNASPVAKRSIDYSATEAGSREAATVQILTVDRPVTYYVEIADSPAAIARGLMYRTAMAQDSGMLFVFESDANRYFWMKDTLIPLDLIYLSGDGRVVGVRENAVPRSTRAIRPPGPCRYVLEVSGGQCRRQGIGAGDRVTIGPA
jgi:uncharacterized membrane protein (UPF0127 family)